jgi:hypothetical protein
VYTKLVYTEVMKNITLSADEELIEKARERAKRERKTLNAAFREWLERYAGTTRPAEEFDQLMRSLAHVKFPRTFSRDEMNSR